MLTGAKRTFNTNTFSSPRVLIFVRYDKHSRAITDTSVAIVEHLSVLWRRRTRRLRIGLSTWPENTVLKRVKIVPLMTHAYPTHHV